MPTGSWYCSPGDPRVVGLDVEIGERCRDEVGGGWYIKNGAAATAWVPLASAFGSGAHTHSQGEVSGLTAALDGKVGTGDPRLSDARTPLTHSHAQSDVTGLVSDLAGKAASAHTHAQSAITNLVTDLAGKAASSHTHAQADVTGLVSALAGKADQTHNHAAGEINAGTMATVRLGAGTADSTTFLRGDSTWAVPSGGGGSASKDDQYYRQVGTSPFERYYVAAQANGTPLTTGAPTVNVLRAFPFISTRGGTLDRIAIQVTTLITNGVGRCGIYQATSDTNLYPSARIVDGNQILTSTTGLKPATINVALTPNTLYWLVYVAGTAAATIRCMSVAGCMSLLGCDNALGTTPGLGISVAFTYGALPASFPAGGAVITAVPLPAIGVRFSA